MLVILNDTNSYILKRGDVIIIAKMHNAVCDLTIYYKYIGKKMQL